MDLLIENGYTNGWLYDRVNQLNRLFNEGSRTAPEAHLVPRSDVVEHGEGYHFYFEMPGIKADSVQVQVEDDNLVIEAERKRPEWPKDSAIHVSERSYGTMRRAFTMPEDAAQTGSRRPIATACSR